MSAIKAQLTEAMKSAMRAQDKDRLGVIRMALAALKQIEVDERIELDDARVIATLDKLIKQRRESTTAYTQAGRQDLADKEQLEISVLQEFLPAALSDAEVDAFISEAIAATGASSARDMGAVMNWLRPKLTGRADMSQVGPKVKAKLG